MKLDIRKVKIAMIRKCFSVNDLVEETKIGRTTISQILNGKKNVTLKCAGLIAKALSVDITELLAEE